ncbi:MAG: ATP-binding cassette domain-containing protein [Gemmatimonadetes bacterium]|nr:ATP-binding cassette domain-containing protein [Gemmatimonadota bacterium]MCH8812598.1 ATP-binding cassette domain-containing protein [Gemmatimonadota bacterium]
MISVEGVTKRFGELVAVRDLDFEIDRGEVVGFLGPNGAGKTTTMRMLTGTLEPDEGRVLYDQVPISQDLTAAKERLGYLPETNPLYEEMLVVEYLEYAAQLRMLSPATARSAISDAVDETGIDDVFFRPVSELSKGYRQRVGLAAAILHHPEILVLDEPTEGLDPNQRVDIRNLVSELGKERTVLLSTHVLQEVEATCTRLLIINRGSLVASGTVAELLSAGKGRSQYTVEAEGDGVAEALSRLPGVDSHTVEQVEGRTRVKLEVSGSDELRPEISRMANERQWVLWELHRGQASLEQLFRELTTEADEAGAESTPNTEVEAETEAAPPATESAAPPATEAAQPVSEEDSEAES